MYIVIEFEVDGVLYISAIPTKWIQNEISDQRKCFWPKRTQDEGKAISKAIDPEDDWLLFEVNRILGCYSNYKEALYHEKNFIKSSESESEVQNNKRRRKKNQKYRDESISPLPQLLETDSETTSVVSSRSDQNFSQAITQIRQDDTPINQGPFKDFASPTPAEIIDAEFIYTNSPNEEKIIDSKHIVNEISLLKDDIRSLREEMITVKTNLILLTEIMRDVQKRISDGVSVVDDMGTHLLPSLPTNTLSEIKDLEELLLNSVIEGQLLTHLKYTGGKTVKICVVRCLEKLFTNEVAQFCSWTGQKGNFRLNNTKCMNIVRNAVKTIHNTVNDDDFEKSVMAWFQHAKTRLERRGKH